MLAEPAKSSLLMLPLTPAYPGTKIKESKDRFKQPPSPCVHVRGLSVNVVEGDLVEAVQHFGKVRDVKLIPNRRQALIEFEDINGAKSCVEYCLQGNSVYCAGQPALFNYSLSQKIERSGEVEDTTPVNHVLLFTVLNPQYPINVDVMHTISSPYGQVKRIVIFRKNGVQAMVEFDSVESAKRAKQALHGADIYSGCCSLKIEYARPTRLNVIRSDSENWDYTNRVLKEKEGPVVHGQQPLLQEPRFGSAPTPYNGPAGHSSGSGGLAGPSHFGGPGYYDDGYDGYGAYGGPGFCPKMSHLSSDRFGRGGYDRQGLVLMVYGLNMDKLNCDKLFNLFCLYGNVVRIKFLKSKTGSAMVQLGDQISVGRAIANLNNVTLFGNRLQLSISKQVFLQEVPKPHELSDGSSSYKDFTASRNNRFNNPEAAQKNRIQAPSKILHFFNAPPNITEEALISLFEASIGKAPRKVKQFPLKTERSSTGLLEFENKVIAMEGLVMVNHTPVRCEGWKTPFIFKLCFSAIPMPVSRSE